MSAVDAIVLTGGSVFGLDAVTGVVDYLEQQHQGAMVGLVHSHRSSRSFI